MCQIPSTLDFATASFTCNIEVWTDWFPGKRAFHKQHRQPKQSSLHTRKIAFVPGVLKSLLQIFHKFKLQEYQSAASTFCDYMSCPRPCLSKIGTCSAEALLNLSRTDPRGHTFGRYLAPSRSARWTCSTT